MEQREPGQQAQQGSPQNIHQQVLIPQMQSQLPAQQGSGHSAHANKQQLLQFQLQAGFGLQAWVPSP